MADQDPTAPVTVEQAAKCPKCGKPGRLNYSAKHTDDNGVDWDVVAYICDNELCIWLNTGWLVQSDKNGIVYQRDQGERGQDKQFERMSPDLKAAGRRYLEDIVRRDLEEPFDPENPHEIKG